MEDFAAFCSSGFHPPVDRIPLGLVDNCAHIDALVQRVTDAHMLHACLKFADELFSDIFLHQQARPGAADLALVEPDGIHNAFVFPRTVHRPGCYFDDEPARISVSPAALEMMGFLVLADVDHFDRIDARVALEIFMEVCAGDERIAQIIGEIP